MEERRAALSFWGERLASTEDLGHAASMIELGEAGDTPAPPRDTATVMLLRDTQGGMEVFMVRRTAKSAFMPNAHVFPGGSVDPVDELSAMHGRAGALTPEEAQHRLAESIGQRAISFYMAALRETFEESGVLFAKAASKLPRETIRGRLLEGEGWDALAAEFELSFLLDQLQPWSRWITPRREKRRFDARFFVARSPEGQRATHEDVEVHAGRWLRPQDALRSAEEKEIMLAPPTLRTLEELAVSSTVEEAFSQARGRRPPCIEPHALEHEGKLTIALPGDPLYPHKAEPVSGPTRIILEDGRFRSVATEPS